MTEPLQPKEFEFNPEHAISYGYYRCPTCSTEFFEGGVHETGCPQENQGSNLCIYVFGPKEAELIIRGNPGALSPKTLTLDKLLEVCPDFVKSVRGNLR